MTLHRKMSDRKTFFRTMNQTNSIEQLCKQVAATANFEISTPIDFERLSLIIMQRRHSTISVSTLKRLWGYAGQDANPRRQTLDLLAQFAGYKDFSAFEAALGCQGDSQSQLFLSDTISAEGLKQGDRLLLTWKPDRNCEITYLGNHQFRVDKAENTKLSVGDTFESLFFINHEPLYINKLIHLSSPTPVSYVAGKRDGIIITPLTPDL